MKQHTGSALGLIALSAAVITVLLGPAAILIPLIGTLSLVYLALTTPPPPTARADKREPTRKDS